MRNIIYSCVLLICLFNQESMSESVTEPSIYQPDDNLQIWKNNATENVQAVHYCIKIHHRHINLIDLEERVGTFDENKLEYCLNDSNNSNNNEILKEIQNSFRKCNDLYRELLKKLELLDVIDRNFVSSSREKIDSCYKNLWEEWKPKLFNRIDRNEKCIQIRAEKFAEEIANKRNDPKFKNYCVIENGVLLNRTDRAKKN